MVMPIEGLVPQLVLVTPRASITALGKLLVVCASTRALCTAAAKIGSANNAGVNEGAGRANTTRRARAG